MENTVENKHRKNEKKNVYNFSLFFKIVLSTVVLSKDLNTPQQLSREKVDK